jgi:hypothetical protein
LSHTDLRVPPIVEFLGDKREAFFGVVYRDVPAARDVYVILSAELDAVCGDGQAACGDFDRSCEDSILFLFCENPLNAACAEIFFFLGLLFRKQFFLFRRGIRLHFFIKAGLPFHPTEQTHRTLLFSQKQTQK